MQRLQVEYVCTRIDDAPPDCIVHAGKRIVALVGPYRDLTLVAFRAEFLGTEPGAQPFAFTPGNKYRVVIEEIAE